MDQWLKLPAWKFGYRGFEPHYVLKVSKKQNASLPLTRKNFNIEGSVRDRLEACSASDRQGSNFKCLEVVSSHSSQLPQEVYLVKSGI